MQKSSNCSGYANSISLLTEVSAQVGSDEKCRVGPIGLFSCQTTQMEHPDETTRRQLEDLATLAMKDVQDRVPACAGELKFAFSTTQVGTRNPEIAPAELAENGLTSNCHREGNDPNLATHIVNATCHHPYDFKNPETGATWRDYSKKFYASLSACDISDRAIAQVYEDVTRVAAHNANESGWNVESYKNLTCNFSVLPRI